MHRRPRTIGKSAAAAILVGAAVALLGCTSQPGAWWTRSYPAGDESTLALGEVVCAEADLVLRDSRRASETRNRLSDARLLVEADGAHPPVRVQDIAAAILSHAGLSAPQEAASDVVVMITGCEREGEWVRIHVSPFTPLQSVETPGLRSDEISFSTPAAFAQDDPTCAMPTGTDAQLLDQGTPCADRNATNRLDEKPIAQLAPGLVPSPYADSRIEESQRIPDGLGPVIEAARAQVGVTVSYDGTYQSLAYPGGDVPPDRGVCTDVLIRAYRTVGVDLQMNVHEDMQRNWAAYPKLWGLTRPDRNIDHRRVPNLAVYFSRHGRRLPVSDDAAAYRPGDIVTWRVPVPHIGIVSDRRVDGRPLILHNIGAGVREEDMLFDFPITGRYRFPVPVGDHDPFAATPWADGGASTVGTR